MNESTGIPIATVARHYRTAAQWLRSNVFVAVWMVCVWAVGAMTAHGFTACGEWLGDGCYQVVSEKGGYEIMDDMLWSGNRRVGVGATPNDAWSMAARACGEESAP